MEVCTIIIPNMQLCVLRVELPPARRSEARVPETQEDGNIVDTIISLLCGIICKDEQANKTEEVGNVS